MIDSIVLMTVGLVGILTPFIVLSFGLALIVGLYSVLNAAYKGLISARHRRSSPMPLKETNALQALPKCPKGEVIYDPTPNHRIAA